MEARADIIGNLLDSLSRVLKRDDLESRQVPKIFGFTEKLQMAEIDSISGSLYLKSKRKTLASQANQIMDAIEERDKQRGMSQINSDHCNSDKFIGYSTAQNSSTASIYMPADVFLDISIQSPKSTVQCEASIRQFLVAQNNLVDFGFLNVPASSFIFSTLSPFASPLCTLARKLMPSCSAAKIIHSHTAIAANLLAKECSKFQSAQARGSPERQNRQYHLFVSVIDRCCHFSVLNIELEVTTSNGQTSSPRSGSVRMVHFSSYCFENLTGAVAEQAARRRMIRAVRAIESDKGDLVPANATTPAGRKQLTEAASDMTAVWLVGLEAAALSFQGESKNSVLSFMGCSPQSIRLMEILRYELTQLFPHCPISLADPSVGRQEEVMGFGLEMREARGASLVGASMFRQQGSATSQPIVNSVSEVATVTVGLLTSESWADPSDAANVFLPVILPSTSLPAEVVIGLQPLLPEPHSKSLANLRFEFAASSCVCQEPRSLGSLVVPNPLFLSSSSPTEQNGQNGQNGVPEVSIRVRMDEERQIFASYRIFQEGEEVAAAAQESKWSVETPIFAVDDAHLSQEDHEHWTLEMLDAHKRRHTWLDRVDIASVDEFYGGPGGWRGAKATKVRRREGSIGVGDDNRVGLRWGEAVGSGGGGTRLGADESMGESPPARSSSRDEMEVLSLSPKPWRGEEKVREMPTRDRTFNKWHCPAHADSYRIIGNVSMTCGDYEEADRLYSMGLVYDRGTGTIVGSDFSASAAVVSELHVMLLSNRCAARTQLGALEPALRDALRCVELRPLWGKAYSRAGLVYFRQGRLEEAEKAYTDGLRVESDSEPLRKALKDVQSAKQALLEQTLKKQQQEVAAAEKLKKDARRTSLCQFCRLC